MASAGGKIDILVEPDLRGFDNKLESGLGSALGVAGKIAAGIGVALGAAGIGREIVAIGTDFQSTMNTMAAVSQGTAEQMNAVRAKARELGSDISLTGASASDAAAAMTELAKAGLSIEQSMTAAKGTLQLAAAAQVSAAEAATIQGQALQAFGLDASYAAKVADIFAGAANASSAEMSDVSLGLKAAGSVAHQFGVSIEDTTTALAMFANAGITGSDAGTLLKTSMLALTDQGKPAQKAIAELGLAIYDAQGKFVGLPVLMGQLNSAAKRMTDEQYQAATATLFGSDAIRFAGIAAQQGSAGFETLRSAVVRQGQAAEVAAAQTEGLPGALERLNNTKEEVLLGIFDVLQNDLVRAADAGAMALEKVGPIAARSFQIASEAVSEFLTIATPIALNIGGVLSDFASAASSAYGPIVGLAGALALSSWTNFPARMNAGTTSIHGMVQAIRVQKHLATSAGKEIGTLGASIAALEARSPVISRMNEAWRTGSSSLLNMGANTRRVSKDLEGFERAAGLAKGTAQSFGGVLGGTVHSGFSVMKSGASGLIGLLGGPWGVALTVAGAAVGLLAQRHAEAAAAEAEHKAQVDELRTSLDQATGSITEQTRALQLKTAEEEGWLKTARELGIEQGVVVDAMNGVPQAMQQVSDAVRRSNEEAIAGSEFWQKYGDRIKEAGGEISTFALALSGDKSAFREANTTLEKLGYETFGPSARAQWSRVKKEIEDSQKGILDFNAGVDASAQKLAEAEQASRRMALESLISGEKLKGIFAKVGSAIDSIPSEKNIILTSAAPKIREDLEALGAKITDLPDGRVNVEFPNALDLQQALDLLQVKTQSLPDGRIEITDNTPEVIDRVLRLGIAVRDEKTGKVFIKDNVAKVITDVNDLKANVSKGASGKITVDATHAKNETDSVRGKLDSIKDKTVRIRTVHEEQRIQYWESRGMSARTYGPVPLTHHAMGGRLPKTGPGTHRVDGFLGVDDAGTPIARVSRGEWVINEQSSTKYDRLLRAINEDRLPALAHGGRISDHVKKALAPYDGTPYILGGWSPRGTDCSGGVSMGVNAFRGEPVFASRMSTVNEGQWLDARGAKAGRGNPGDLIIGWWDRGGGKNGHTAMQLPDGTYIESGGNTGGGLTIGRTAGPLDGRGFNQWRHFPVSAGENSSGSDLFSSVGSARSISWGAAQELFNLAMSRYAVLHDTGGLLGHGRYAFNNSGRPERILDPLVTAAFEKFAPMMPLYIQTMDRFTAAANTAINDYSDKTANFAPVANSQIVMDAEKGLAETRKALAEETKDIREQEKAVAEARRGLSKAERDSADKLAKANAKLVKARKSGKADRIAAAERELAKTREDLPDKTRAAVEKVEKAEEKLAELREQNADAAQRLEAAERTVVAARMHAIGDFVRSIADNFAAAAQKISAYFGAVANAAEYMEQLRSDVDRMRSSQVQHGLNLIRAMNDLTLAEWELHRVKAESAVQLAEGERTIMEGHSTYTRMGATSIEAMATAAQNFEQRGRFAIEQFTVAAEGGVARVIDAEKRRQALQAQAQLDLLDATHRQEMAQLAVVEASLAQAQAAELLRVKTQELHGAAAEFFGMSVGEARGAQQGFAGAAQVAGGLGKALGGAAAGAAAGFSIGGPAGALVGGLVGALSGIGDVVKGAINIHHNKAEMKAAWEKMPDSHKAGLALGVLGGGALNAASGVAGARYGQTATQLFDTASASWHDATIGALGHDLELKIAKRKEAFERQSKELEYFQDSQRQLLAAEKAAKEAKHAAELAAAQAEVEKARYKQRAAEATTEAEMKALNEAARVAAERREAMLLLAQRNAVQADAQLKSLREILSAANRPIPPVKVQLNVTSHADSHDERFTREDLMYAIESTAAQITAAQYVDARI